MKSRCFAATLLFVAPMSASAQMNPGQPEAVAEAVADCWAAVGPRGVDQSVLARAGWRAGSMKDRQGGRVETPLQVFGKANSDVVLMLMSTADVPGCTIVSRLGKAADVNVAAQAVQRRLTAADPQVKTARAGKSIAFLAQPKMAMLDATGTKDRPAMRVVVGFQGSNSK